MVKKQAPPAPIESFSGTPTRLEPKYIEPIIKTAGEKGVRKLSINGNKLEIDYGGYSRLFRFLERHKSVGVIILLGALTIGAYIGRNWPQTWAWLKWLWSEILPEM